MEADWISALSSVASAFAAIVALGIAIGTPIYQQKKETAKSNNRIILFKKIVTDYLKFSYINLVKLEENDMYETLDFIFFKNDKEFNDWLKDTLLTLPSEKETKILSLANQCLDDVYDMNYPLANNNGEIIQSPGDVWNVYSKYIKRIRSL